MIFRNFLDNFLIFILFFLKNNLFSEDQNKNLSKEIKNLFFCKYCGKELIFFDEKVNLENSKINKILGHDFDCVFSYEDDLFCIEKKQDLLKKDDHKVNRDYVILFNNKEKIIKVKVYRIIGYNNDRISNFIRKKIEDYINLHKCEDAVVFFIDYLNNKNYLNKSENGDYRIKNDFNFVEKDFFDDFLVSFKDRPFCYFLSKNNDLKKEFYFLKDFDGLFKKNFSYEFFIDDIDLSLNLNIEKDKNKILYNKFLFNNPFLFCLFLGISLNFSLTFVNFLINYFNSFRNIFYKKDLMVEVSYNENENININIKNEIDYNLKKFNRSCNFSKLFYNFKRYDLMENIEYFKKEEFSKLIDNYNENRLFINRIRGSIFFGLIFSFLSYNFFIKRYKSIYNKDFLLEKEMNYISEINNLKKRIYKNYKNESVDYEFLKNIKYYEAIAFYGVFIFLFAYLSIKKLLAFKKRFIFKEKVNSI